MKCLPLKFHKLETDLNRYVTYWFEDCNEGSMYNSFNDQPSSVEIIHCAIDGEVKYLFWYKRHFGKRTTGKPYSICLENGVIASMKFSNPEPEKMEDVHPDYRNDWIRLHIQESDK